MENEISSRTNLTYEQAIDEYMAIKKILDQQDDMIEFSDYENRLQDRQIVLLTIIDKHKN